MLMVRVGLWSGTGTDIRGRGECPIRLNMRGCGEWSVQAMQVVSGGGGYYGWIVTVNHRSPPTQLSSYHATTSYSRATPFI